MEHREYEFEITDNILCMTNGTITIYFYKMEINDGLLLWLNSQQDDANGFVELNRLWGFEYEDEHFYLNYPSTGSVFKIAIEPEDAEELVNQLIILNKE